MTHKRKQIRDQLVTMLDTGSIVASGNVFANRARQLSANLLPAIYVSTAEESSAPRDVVGIPSQRDLTFVVEIKAKETEDETVADTLDALADKVEDAIEADPFLANLADGTDLVSTKFEQDDSGEVIVGTLRLTFQSIYTY